MYHVSVVSMRFKDCFEELSRRHNSANAGSFFIHAIRLLTPVGIRSFRDSSISSSSENVITQAVNIATTCSTIISAVRDRLPALVPTRNACSCPRQALMSDTSCRTPLASLGASFVPRMKVVKVVETFAVARSRPTTDTAMERGSMGLDYPLPHALASDPRIDVPFSPKALDS